MLAKFASKELREVAYMVGGVVLFFAAWSLWHTAERSEKAPEVVQQAQAQGQEEKAGAGCSCSSGNCCEGPRGGSYCLTETGAKRYKR